MLESLESWAYTCPVCGTELSLVTFNLSQSLPCPWGWQLHHAGLLFRTRKKKSSLSAKCPLRKLLPSTGFLKTVVLCLPYLNLLHLLQCSQKKALLTFFSMQCWVCVMPALCNWKSFFLFHKSTGTFWKIQNILHIENLSSRSGSGWQRYTVVLYYLGPADTVDRWWLSTNKHYVPSINVFFLVHLVQSVQLFT